MNTGQTQWWPSRTASAIPVAGWTSSVGKGRTTSAWSFWQWSLCECSISSPVRWWWPGTWMTPLQPQCCSWWWVGGVQWGFLLKSTIISTVFSMFSSRLLWLHQTDNSFTSYLLFVSRLVSVVDEADDGRVFCNAFICIQGEEYWGENTSLRSTIADRKSPGCEFAQPH